MTTRTVCGLDLSQRGDIGFFGNVRTLIIDVKLAILPAETSETENAPDHRVFCEGLEVGASWSRTGEMAGRWLSVAIDDPSFMQPMRARLFESDADKGVWTMHWDRLSKRDERT